MSYQSGYQYANVPSNEDPLSNASTTNNTNNSIDTTGYSDNGPTSSSAQQHQPQQQTQQQEGQPLNNNIPPSTSSISSNTVGTGATAQSSTYAPRAYLPTYHDYMQSHGQQSHSQGYSQQNGMGGAGGGGGYDYASNQYFGPSAAYFESLRKTRRNKIIIGIVVGFLLLSMLSHHPDNRSAGPGAATGTGAGIDVVSGGGGGGGSSSTDTSDSGGGETSGVEPGNNGNDDDTTSASSGADATGDNTADTADATNSDSAPSSTVDPSAGGMGPKLTYLLTYPMSGTTFTMEILGKLTGMAMATNYERFHPYLEKSSGNSNGLNNLRPISTDFPDLLNKIPKGQQGGGEYGYPFWTSSYPETTVPSTNILTFSHCDGFCLYPCEPSQYLHTPSSFEESCRTVTFYNQTKKNYDSYVTPRNNLNDVSLDSSNSNTIGGIIHLIRDPLSNIVSRYHEYLAVNEVEWWLQRDNKVNTNQLHDQRESFHEWCNDMDTNSTLNAFEQHQHHTYATTPKTASTHFFSFELEQKMKSIPCHSEFVKYVAWHNHVVEMIWSRGYNSIEVYFEHYASEEKRIEEAQRMAGFLGYDVKSTIMPVFAGGKLYREGYYSEDDVKALMEFIQFMSFDKTWELLKHYFVEER
eukprot:CAMPEP_0203671550 /NCGR_PEP_ID=MMETSP0090-20130426/7296_1 /ASSEMBLY_ACC=CAM_ASM_001088 /TAXON_ID=426623 /ORGANISM="Chaetoceros affinis, Strain CCMP159" /LENGTH=635 /DNA_ID=CAMNT_0050536641 /DNA_START=54 /DNA_END=1961 /DNA_ORIENTATION=-